MILKRSPARRVRAKALYPQETSKQSQPLGEGAEELRARIWVDETGLSGARKKVQAGALFRAKSAAPREAILAPAKRWAAGATRLLTRALGRETTAIGRV